MWKSTPVIREFNPCQIHSCLRQLSTYLFCHDLINAQPNSVIKITYIKFFCPIGAFIHYLFLAFSIFFVSSPHLHRVETLTQFNKLTLPRLEARGLYAVVFCKMDRVSCQLTIHSVGIKIIVRLRGCLSSHDLCIEYYFTPP